jgi:hypothetical protein
MPNIKEMQILLLQVTLCVCQKEKSAAPLAEENNVSVLEAKIKHSF